MARHTCQVWSGMQTAIHKSIFYFSTPRPCKSRYVKEYLTWILQIFISIIDFEDRKDHVQNIGFHTFSNSWSPACNARATHWEISVGASRVRLRECNNTHNERSQCLYLVITQTWLCATNPMHAGEQWIVIIIVVSVTFNIVHARVHVQCKRAASLLLRL